MHKVRGWRDSFLNLQQMTIVIRPSCWHKKFGLNGLSAPAQGLCLNFFSSITANFNISSALSWVIQDQWSSGSPYDTNIRICSTSRSRSKKQILKLSQRECIYCIIFEETYSYKQILFIVLKTICSCRPFFFLFLTRKQWKNPRERNNQSSQPCGRIWNRQNLKPSSRNTNVILINVCCDRWFKGTTEILKQVEFIRNLSINCQTEINWFWNSPQTPTNWTVDLKVDIDWRFIWTAPS